MNLEALQPVITAMNQERSCERVMQAIVSGLTERAGLALARVWIRGPGDDCETCHLRAECPDRTECLHLVASAGHSVAEGREPWTKLDGRFRRFPLGIRKIGHIGATGDGVLVENVQTNDRWIADQHWAAKEGIKSFAGHPLTFRGELLGVMGVFCREGLNARSFQWLRVFADQAAIAVANARAFEEIERLTRELQDENVLLREELASDSHGDNELIGTSEAMRHMKQQIALVAPTEAAILIQGESGTGKELVARAIHRQSRRGNNALIKVNCAAIPRDLFESEFFGHVKGAFTGAVRDRVGRFQLADRGTLFLDEVGEIPLELQSKLLRVLQEGEFERIGETGTRKVDVRIIAATNRDLRGEVDAGRFREDLFYRLSVFPVLAPPLRDRREDIPALTSHFLQAASLRLNLPSPAVSLAELERLRAYQWPGNVRELAHVVERAVIVSRGKRADFEFLTRSETVATASTEPTHSGPADSSAPVRRDTELRQEQIKNIRHALTQAEGRVYGPGGAADILGIPPTTLTSRIRRWGIRKPS